MKSRAGYWLGGCLITLGVVGAIFWLVTSLTSLSKEVDDFQRAPLTGVTTMQFEARKYVVYYEGPSANEFVPPFDLEIVEAQTGKPLALAAYGGSLTYSINDHEGSAQATVTPAHAGAYVVRTNSDLPRVGSNVALGPSIAGQLLRGILGTFAIGGLLVASGGILIAITAVRRSRSRRTPTGQGGLGGRPQPD